jgi:hypothetical protein
MNFRDAWEKRETMNYAGINKNKQNPYQAEGKK